MKLSVFLLLILLSYCGFGQKIGLLSQDFKRPILYTDSLTAEQVTSGYFPVGVNDFDTLIGSLSNLKKLLSKGLSRSKVQSWEFRSGNTTLKTSRIPSAYGDSYDVVVSSKFNDVSSSFRITTEKKNKRNAERIEALMKYIEKNRTILKSSYEINPKYYEVIIIKE